MKDSETDSELIDLIVKTLENYEEKYILGSWENFIRVRRRRRRFILWFAVTGIAASLLAGWIGFRTLLPGTAGVKSGSPYGKETISLTETPSAADKSNQPGLKDRGPVFKVEEGNVRKPAIQTEQKAEETISLRLPANGQISLLTPKYSTQTVKISGLRALSRASAPDKTVSSEIEADQQTKPKLQRFRLGVNVSPGVTATTTVTSFSYSGGVNADIDLSRSFRISTGLQVEHQNVINQSNDNPSWIPAGKSQALLVDLDLPVNITWKFLSGKAACYYISGGVSSVAYLSEKYINTNYSQKVVAVVNSIGYKPDVTYRVENVKNTEKTTETPLSTFDLAGRVNIILGFEQHLSSRLFLHIEPYLKIPLSDQASRDLRFTTSGITCKISF